MRKDAERGHSERVSEIGAVRHTKGRVCAAPNDTHAKYRDIMIPALECAPQGTTSTIPTCQWTPWRGSSAGRSASGARHHEERCVVNGCRAFMAATVARLLPSLRGVLRGVPDRGAYAASRGRKLALSGLNAVGIAPQVRAMFESEAIAR